MTKNSLAGLRAEQPRGLEARVKDRYESADELYAHSMNGFTPIYRETIGESLVVVYARDDSYFLHRDLACSINPITVPGYIRIETYKRGRPWPVSVRDYEILSEKLPTIHPFSTENSLFGIIANCLGTDYAIEKEPDIDPMLELYLGMANGRGRGDA